MDLARPRQGRPPGNGPVSIALTRARLQGRTPAEPRAQRCGHDTRSVGGAVSARAGAGSAAGRPAARRRPGARRAGRGRPRTSSWPSRRTAALGHQPPRLRARVAEGRGDEGREVHLAAVARDREVVDLLGRLVAHDRAVEVLLGAARRPPGPRSAPRSPAPARAWRRIGAAAAGGALDAQQLEPRRPSPRRAGSSSCRTSPRAARSTPTWLPSDLDIFSTPSSPGRIGIVRTACSGWP